MTKQHHRFRAQPAEHLAQDFRIDREANVIRGVCAMQAGVEALGHGCQADMKTLYMMVDLANKRADRGIKQHFGHIGMSENAMGKQVAIARNFRVEGDKLRHDMHMLDPSRKSPAFAQDPVEYLFDMAENNPQDFGESVVIEVEFYWTLDDGREIPEYRWGGSEIEGVEWDGDERPVNALTPLPVMRPITFYYCDVVVDGALTHDGLFGADATLAEMFSGTSSAYLYEGYRLLDQFLGEYGIPLAQVRPKFDQVLTNYLHSRGYQEDKDMSLSSNRKTSNRKKFDTTQPASEATPTTPAADEQEPTPVESAATDDELDAALETADETERRQADAPEEQGRESDEPADEALSVRIERLEQVVLQQQELIDQQQITIDKLARLSVKNTESIAALDRNIRRIDGDPVVHASVPMTRPSPLESLDALLDGPSHQQFAAPRPPVQAMTQKPKHVSERRNGEEQAPQGADPEAWASLQASKRRSKTQSDL